jgi:hypothetical protein
LRCGWQWSGSGHSAVRVRIEVQRPKSRVPKAGEVRGVRPPQCSQAPEVGFEARYVPPPLRQTHKFLRGFAARGSQVRCDDLSGRRGHLLRLHGRIRWVARLIEWLRLRIRTQ